MQLLTLSFILLAAFTDASIRRHIRDVSELLPPPNYDYLPPSRRLQLADAEAGTSTDAIPTTTIGVATETPTTSVAATFEIPASAVRSTNGYEYRTVRRLKYRFRTRRDVSHLQQQQHQQPQPCYLPPPPSPSQPPSSPATQQEVAQPVDDSEIVETPTLNFSNDYLPPVDDENEVVEAITEAAEVTKPEQTENEVPPEDEEITMLAADGYRYKKPSNPMEILVQPKAVENEDDEEEVLSSLAKGVVVETVGPNNESSAILANDGYRYRAVKRLRF